MQFDKLKVRSNFDKSAINYSQKAFLQRNVANHLSELSIYYINKFDRILDLGSGTGFLADNIHYSFPSKTIYQIDFSYNMLKESFANNRVLNISADIEFLPFRCNDFDLILSSLALQWINNLQKTVESISKLLCLKKGYFIFSIIGDDSLKELKESCVKVGVNLSINDFIKKEDVEKIISNNFSDYKITSQIFELEYNDVYDLLRSIKSIGASYSSNNNMITRYHFDEINNFYLKNFKIGSTIKASWKIFYLICKI